MGTALEKINKIASNEVSSWKKEATERRKNIAWTKYSFKIAVRILQEIRAQKSLNGMSQKKLADKMAVSPQYINKVIKGNENLTLETISKIENVLGITLIEVSSFETSIPFSLKNIEDRSALKGVNSIPISREAVWPYNNKPFSHATGTYG